MKRTRILVTTLSATICGALVALAFISTVPALALASTAEASPTSVAAEQSAPSAQTQALRPAPVLVVDSYEVSEDRLLVGSPFTLKIDVQNETARIADNVVISLGNSTSATPAEAGATGSTGLTVLGTGNAKYLGRLRGSRAEEVSFEVVAGPSTPPGAMTVPVTISFEYGGERHELAHTIGLVFDRNAGLSVANVEIPTSARQGEPFGASFELANTGRFTLSGMSMSVETTNGTVTDGSVFVGAFEAAAAETIDVQITPEKAGPMDVVLVARYRDDFGREKTFRTPYKVEVEGAPKPSDDPNARGSDKNAGQKGNWFARFLSALFGLGA